MGGIDIVNAAIDRVSSSAGKRDSHLSVAASRSAEAMEFRRLADEADLAALLATDHADRAGVDLEDAYGELAGLGVPREKVDAFVGLRRDMLASIGAVAPPSPPAAPPSPGVSTEAAPGEGLAVDPAPTPYLPGIPPEPALPAPVTLPSPGDGTVDLTPAAAHPAPVDTDIAVDGSHVDVEPSPATQGKAPAPRKRNRSRAAPQAAANEAAIDGSAIPAEPAGMAEAVNGIDAHASAGIPDAVVVEAGEPPVAVPHAEVHPLDPGDMDGGRAPDWYERRNQPDPEDMDDGQGRFDDEARDPQESFPEVRGAVDGEVPPSGTGPDPVAQAAGPVPQEAPARRAVPEASPTPAVPAAPSRPARMGLGIGIVPDFLRGPAVPEVEPVLERVEDDDPIPF